MSRRDVRAPHALAAMAVLVALFDEYREAHAALLPVFR